jgi:hypothetical protein
MASRPEVEEGLLLDGICGYVKSYVTINKGVELSPYVLASSTKAHPIERYGATPCASAASYGLALELLVEQCFPHGWELLHNMILDWDQIRLDLSNKL